MECNNCGNELEGSEIDNCVECIDNWIESAYVTMHMAFNAMTQDQRGKVPGIRSVLESCPIDNEMARALNKSANLYDEYI